MTHQVFFSDQDMIVSRTDTRGIIHYANATFLNVSGYTEVELLGRPHSMIRHPDMPRCVFQLLWDTIQQGHEIFAFVKNQCKNGDYYWVLAYVTPDVHPDTKETTGYFSVRRVANTQAIAQISELYQQLLKIEHSYGTKKAGIEAATTVLLQRLQESNLTYSQFVYLLQQGAYLPL